MIVECMQYAVESAFTPYGLQFMKYHTHSTNLKLYPNALQSWLNQLKLGPKK